MSNASWATKYVGLPFAEGGRGPQVFDCWGLVRKVLHDEHGIDLDAYDPIATNDGPAIAAKVLTEIEHWREVAEPQAFDVAVLWVNRPFSRTLSHLGIVAAPDRLLHTEENFKRSVCVRFADIGPAFRIHAFYRHRSLTT